MNQSLRYVVAAAIAVTAAYAYTGSALAQDRKAPKATSSSEPRNAGQIAPPQRRATNGKVIPARLDEMIGQMIMVGFRGTNPTDKGVKAVKRHLRAGTIGGVILFGINIKSPKQTRALNRSLANVDAKLPILIAVDQEGGRVQRLSKKNGFHSTNSHKYIASENSVEEAEEIYGRMARTIAKAGFNVNFGPVVDVDLKGKRNPIIGKLRRSFSKNPETVSAYARSFIGAHHRRGILISTKHFPGHGSSLVDSHKGFTDITKTWNPVKELAPYILLAKQKVAVDMVMVGHLYHPDFSDGRGRPATLSAKAVKGLLRRTVGDDVVAITDDMEMGAIRKGFTWKAAIIKAVKAGNDILLYSNTAEYSPNLGPRIHAVIKEAVVNGTISTERIANSYRRIRLMKERLRNRR